MKDQIIESIKQNKLIVIVRGVKREHLIPLAEAMYAGGVRLLEITYDPKGVTPDEETAAGIRDLATHFDGRMLIGAGTVLTEKQVELTKEAGGRFIISPNTSRAVIGRTVACGLVSIPGALTPSEVVSAYDYGADFVKLFPIADLGVSYVKAVRAPLSHIPLLAVGGIDLDNIKDYAAAGVCGFGIGSSIVNRRLIEAGDFEAITDLARQYVEAI